MGTYAFGVDIGGTSVKMGLFDRAGCVLDKWEIPTVTEDGGSAILPDVGKSILARMEEKQISREELVGIGIGAPGAVDEEGTLVSGAVNLGWKSFNIPEALKAYINVPVRAVNDANAAGLAEVYGTPDAGDLVYLSLSNSVGGGIARLARRRLARDQQPSVLRGGHISAKTVFDAVKAGDQVAMEIAQQFGEYLGKGLACVASVVDPEAFVIGGGVSKAGEVLLSYIEPPYQKYAFQHCKRAKFVLAKLGNDAGIYGAAGLFLR